MRLIVSLTVMLGLIALPAHAQDQPAPAATTAPSPSDEQAVQQQIREQFQTMIGNMVAKGINPQDFFQQIQNGAAMSDVEKQLIDQGIVDQKTIDQMQSNMLFLTSRRIQRQLDATDEEWKALWPLVQKVMTASAAVNGNRPGAGMSRFIASTTPAAIDLAHATQALRAATQDPKTTPDQFTNRLSAYREARAAMQAELETDRENLRSVLTLRQEGELTTMGLLE
jgi:hypothetical protein